MRLPVGALTGAAVLVLVAGCNTAPGDSDESAGSNGQPNTQAQPGGATKAPLNVNVAEALEIAEKEFAALKEGNWAAAWQLWTETAKKEVPKDVFVEANKACPTPLKQEYELQAVTPVSNELIELTFRRGGTEEHGALRGADGKWAFEPGGGMLVEYASGADATIEKRKSDKNC